MAGSPATHGEGEDLYGIVVRESGAGVLVELWGEFDLFSLSDLRKKLNGVLDLHRTILVDLSGITFLDLVSARELALRSQLYDRHLTLRNPSAQVRASLEAFGLWSWVPFHPGAGHEEPPLVPEASH